MEQLLSFFSDLILITAGLVVVIFWLGLFALISIEAWDRMTGYDKKHDQDEEEDY